MSGDLSVRDGSRLVVVDIADQAVSADPSAVLVTYSLGSCIGLSLYDPQARVGGLIHCMLPLSSKSPGKAAEKPSMFVDTGVSLLLQSLFDRGADRHRIVAKLAGGSVMLDEDGVFRIGERNVLVCRKILWKNSVRIAAEDTAGREPRTMYLHMSDGSTRIKSGTVPREL